MKGDAGTIYESLTVQLSYAQGTAARDAIDKAYGDSQRYVRINPGDAVSLAYALT